MKTYNINPSTIKIADFQITGIILGEKGRGRKETIIPTPEGGLMEPGVSRAGKPRLNKSASSSGWIARISTEGNYVRGANGNVSVHPEHQSLVRVIARGHGAFGAAGRIGTWDDLLLLVEGTETLLRVKPSRGDAHILLFGEEKVSRLSFPEAEALDLGLGTATPTSKGDFIRL